MMKHTGAFVLAALLGIAVGVGTAYAIPYVLTARTLAEAGPWRTAKAIGSPEANPYLRAWVARRGIWALPRQEAVYYSAETDSGGEALRPECTYLIRGADLPARWWSITAYRDHFWMDNALDRYSVSSTTLENDFSSTWKVTFGEKKADVNWLPSDGKPGVLSLLLRLYDPNDDIAEDPARLEAPSIEKGDCQ